MRKILSLISLTAFLSVAACEEDVEIPASLDIPEESQEYFYKGINFTATSAEGTLTVKVSFTSSLDWSASILDAEGNPVSWLTVSPTSGKAGDTAITITAQDNTSEEPRSAKVTVACGSINKTVNVTQAGFKPAVVEVADIMLDHYGMELEPGQTAQLTPIVKPDNATDKTITWSSSNTAVATVADGLVTGIAPGEAVISASAGSKKTDCNVTVIDPAAIRAVDLGLSVKWGNMNLGASSPEEYGDYFAWGELEPYYSSQDPLTWKDDKPDGYDWKSYKWCNGDYNKLTKYCPANKTSYWDAGGSPDDKTTLDLEDDAAHAALGGKWRMPTDADWTKLRNNCDWKWTNDYNGTGVAGMIITSKKSGYTDKSIFLPAAGYRWSTKEDVYHAGSEGHYWSSLDPDYPNSAYYRYFSSAIDYRRSEQRYEGLSIRPVSEK